MRSMVGSLILGTGLGIAHFGFGVTSPAEKPAALQPATLSPAVEELRALRPARTKTRETSIEVPSPATIGASAHVRPASTKTLPNAVKPSHYATRRELVRAIQQELARAGCYSGAKDGEWRRATKRAMGAFLAGVNASLPLDEPDYILLNLIRSDTRPVCTMATRAQSVAGSPQSTASFRSDLPGRMSIGGPVSGASDLIAGPAKGPSNWRRVRSRFPGRRSLPRSPGRRSIREILLHPLTNPQD